MMTVYKNSVYMIEGKDYEFNEAGDRIVAMNGEVFKAGTVFGFVVLKEVPVVEEGEVIDGRVIEDGSIGLDKLDAEVKEAIEAAGNIDMSEYVSEEELEAKGYLTEHQDLSGYATKEELNELFQDVDSGKTIIADAIDDRNINKDSTFAAMGEAIEGIHADREEDRQKLIDILVGSNMDLTGNESMDTLLDLIDMSNIDLSKVVQIDCSLNSSYLVKNDGTLWACGRNDYGQLGLGDTTNRTTFTQVEIDNVKYISCGGFHTFIIKNDGSVWSCGLNDTGQLGLGDTTNRDTFVQVTTNINNDVKQIACGYEIGSGGFTIIIKNDGSLYACGYNNAGQLGLGDTTQRNSFTQVTTNINNDVKQVACGSFHTVILKNDGSVWSCGYNNFGQLGLSSYTAQNTFTQVTTNINNDVKQITCGSDHTLILKNDGSVLGAGSSSSYQLASGTDSKPSFTLIANDVKKLGELSTGSSTTFIIKNDNSVWVRGHHYYGQAIVPGSPNAVRNFTEVEDLSNDEIEQIVNSNHTIILKADGSVWTCGLNEYGQLGIGNTTNSGLKAINEIEALKTQIQTLNTEATTNRGNLATMLTDEGVELTGNETLADLIVKTDAIGINTSDIKEIAYGQYHGLILYNDGTLYSCGYNSYGQLGLGDADNRSMFEKINNIDNVKQIACCNETSFALKNDGTLYVCGGNYYGQMGINVSDDTNKYANFFHVYSDVAKVCCGQFHTFIIKTDGTVFVCGLNNQGQLGLGDTTNRIEFTQVSITDVKDIVCGQYYSIAIKNDGTMWSCGLGQYGQLGLGNAENKSTFTQVSITDVKTVACGNAHTLVLKNDGTVYSCGYNNKGQLGLNTTGTGVNGTLTKVDVEKVVGIFAKGNYSYMIKNDGNVYSCGANAFGQLGHDDKTDRYVFTQISYLENIKSVAGGINCAMILKHNGDIFSTGANVHGQLGLSDNIDRTKFEQINDYIELLNQLNDNKQDLMEVLVNKNIDVSITEDINSLISKVEDIEVNTIPSWYHHGVWIRSVTEDGTTVSMPGTRSGHGSTVVDNRYIYCIGGSTHTATSTVSISASNYCLDTLNNTWSTKSNMPTASEDLVVETYNNQIFVIGGSNGSGSYGYLKQNVCYDITTDSWTAKTDCPTSGFGFGHGIINNFIYCIAGYKYPNNLSTNHVYDVLTNTWSKKNDVDIIYSSNSSVTIGDKIYFMEGETKHYCYDSITDTITTNTVLSTTTSSSYKISSNSIATDGECIYSFGGISSNSTPYAYCYEYNISSDSWSKKSNGFTTRYKSRSEFVNGCIYCIGGVNSDYDGSWTIGSVEVYIPNN